MSKGSNIKKNLILSVSAQLASMIVSLVLSLIVPKIVDEYQYAYWQTFVLYMGYAGIFHFGLLDGIVLRYSQYDYDELDKNVIRSQFKILITIILTIAVIICSIAIFALNGNSKIIVMLIAVGIVTKQLTMYNSYMFQITNRINKYAVLTIIQRMSYGLLVVSFLVTGIKAFYYICIAELIGDMIGFVFTMRDNSKIYFGKSLGLSEAIKECKINISAGIILMIANWSSMLIIGAAKMMVQWHWNELVFGKFSFAFSISNLFLVFVTAISVVLFPSLKRMNPDELPFLYKKLRKYVTMLLFVAMIFYFPTAKLLSFYLPKYSASLIYLGILLPMIVYSSRIGLLTNNYLKAYRKEKQMLIINLSSIGIAALCYFICVYVFENITLLLIAVVIATAFKSISSEIVVSTVIKEKFIRENIIELILALLFVIISITCDLIIGFVLYTLICIAYCFINKKTVAEITASIKNKVRK